jgi:hypothetical protein
MTCRTLYNGVFLPRLAYAASIWAANTLTRVKPSESVISAKRNPLLAITRAYRTVSSDALSVLAGVLPLDLEILKRAKKEAEAVAVRSGAMTADESTKADVLEAEFLDRWSNRWVTSEKGRWTFQWFPTVQARLLRRWVVPDHYTSQFMSGHGDFGDYLQRFNLRGDAHCENCGHAADTVSHVLFDCPMFAPER